MTASPLWTTERTEELKRLHPLHSAAEIAAMLGISRGAVIGKAHRLGLSAPQRENKPKAPRSPNANKNRSGEHHAVVRLRVVNPVGGNGHDRVFKTIEVKQRIPRCEEIVPLHLTLLQLETGDCRYPYGGDNAGDPITFCGHSVQEDSSWCPSHHALCMLPPLPKRDQAPKYFGTDFAKRRA
jgi:GcrA cell cycle regulator